MKTCYSARNQCMYRMETSQTPSTVNLSLRSHLLSHSQPHRSQFHLQWTHRLRPHSVRYGLPSPLPQSLRLKVLLSRRHRRSQPHLLSTGTLFHIVHQASVPVLFLEHPITSGRSTGTNALSLFPRAPLLLRKP